VIFPGGIVRALAKTAEDYYASLHGQWQQPALRRPDVRFRRPERALGTPEMLARASATKIRTRTEHAVLPPPEPGSTCMCRC
jgi:hypothetical protein